MQNLHVFKQIIALRRHYGAITYKHACMLHTIGLAQLCRQVDPKTTSCKRTNQHLMCCQMQACITAKLMDLHGRLQLTLKPDGWRAELFIQPSVPANLSRTDWSYVPPVGSGNKSISKLLRPVRAHQPINTSLQQGSAKFIEYQPVWNRQSQSAAALGTHTHTALQCWKRPWRICYPWPELQQVAQSQACITNIKRDIVHAADTHRQSDQLLRQACTQVKAPCQVLA